MMASTSCNREQVPSIGPEVNASLAIYFKGRATGEDINAFFKQGALKTSP